MRYDLLFAFYDFLHILPPELFGLLCFVQGQFHLPTTICTSFFVKARLEVLLVFENVHIVTHGFLGSQCLEKIQDFLFWSVFNALKNISGYFAITEYVISRHISRCSFRIYIVLYGYKLFPTSYVGLQIKKSEIFAIFGFLPFLAPQRSSKRAL